jgi:Zn-dependent protease with chaperone function
MLRFSAHYFDGQISHAHQVEVHVEPDGTLRLQGLTEPLSVPRTHYRVAPRLGNTPRSINFESGATLETSDNLAIDQLQQQLGAHRVWSVVHLLESRWKAAFACLVLLALLAVGWFKWGIPKFAEQVAKRIPPEMAYDIGAGTLSTLDRFAFKPSLLLPEDQQRIRARFEAIASVDDTLPLTLVFRHAGGPNAFALPDGTIVMTDELVYLADNDDQILSVLAHEVGHLHHRHALRMALESSTMALLISAYVGDAAQMSAIFASLPTVYTQAHYSRSHETEADTFALEYMQTRGIALHHFADILSKLEQKVSGGKHHDALDYWSSHPPTKERIARFK